MQPELRPAIVQDARDGRVLMLAWMDDEALRLTNETGEAWFWSRSRERLWKKGETSGNTLAVEELRDDCDGDALLVRVVPNGPPATPAPRPASRLRLADCGRTSAGTSCRLVRCVACRRGRRAGCAEAGEEGVEAAIAATAKDGRLVSEAADVLFHLYVLLAVAGIDVSEVESELARRAARLKL